MLYKTKKFNGVYKNDCTDLYTSIFYDISLNKKIVATSNEEFCELAKFELDNAIENYCKKHPKSEISYKQPKNPKDDEYELF